MAMEEIRMKEGEVIQEGVKIIIKEKSKILGKIISF
jgi:hypothetical protein